MTDETEHYKKNLDDAEARYKQSGTAEDLQDFATALEDYAWCMARRDTKNRTREIATECWREASAIRQKLAEMQGISCDCPRE